MVPNKDGIIGNVLPLRDFLAGNTAIYGKFGDSNYFCIFFDMFMFDRIRTLLQKPLPGRAAHLEMAPESRIESLLVETPEQVAHARKAAVLILLYDIAGETRTVLIKRPIYDGVHSGQIAFPGGRYEITDKDLTETALREAEEEIGINRHDVTVLGNLSQLYIPPSDFLILPVVGGMNGIPKFTAQTSEVDGILEIPLHTLFDKRNRSTTVITGKDYGTFHAPCYTIDGEIIWGATAMVINEFDKVING